MEIISEAWPEPPPNDHLHFVARLWLTRVVSTSYARLFALAQGIALPEGDEFVDSALVREYEDIFIKVKEWGAFESSDIERNNLRMYVDGTVSDFVAKFERELQSKTGSGTLCVLFP